MESTGFDFIVQEQHLGGICDLLRCNVAKEYWEDIENEFMNRQTQNDVNEYNTFSGRIRESISSWIRNAIEEERKFSIFVAAVREHDCPTAEKLEANRSVWSKITEPRSMAITQIRKNQKKLLMEKWWPNEKFLIISHYERKMENVLIIEKIWKALEQHHDRKTVISQKAAVSGMGGVGKTTTAIWFATHFEELYDYIIWIDCGEGLVAASFKQLAIDLKIENDREESNLNLQKIVKEIFLQLSDSKCLLIYDNAECYVGSEGVEEVLPKNKPNLHCLITSRSPTWEDEFGEIPNIQLESFNSEEGVAFLKKNLRNVEFEESTLMELSTALGHLPLALQIFVSTFNDSDRMQIEQYIQHVKTLKNALHPTNLLDDMETSVVNILSYSLEAIHKKANGERALSILTIFAYICADNIRPHYFAAIEKIPLNEIKEAINLLESFSLVKKGIKKSITYLNPEKSNIFRNFFTGGAPPKKEIVTEEEVVSVHRLLQQVVRYNGRKRERETLQRILNCAGFIENQLIPYRYAEKHEELKKEFFHIRAQLIEQLNLETFWNEQRYAEATQLSRLIHQGIPGEDEHLFLGSLYNRAICTWKNGEVEEATQFIQTIFEIGAKIISGNDRRSISYCEDFELTDIKNSNADRILAHLCVQLQNHRYKISYPIIRLKEGIAHSLSVDFKVGDIPCDLSKIFAFKTATIRGKILYPTEKNSDDDFVMEEMMLFNTICVNRNSSELIANPSFHEMFNERTKKLTLYAEDKYEIRLDLSKLCDTIQHLTLQRVEISLTEKISSSLVTLVLTNCTMTSSLNEILLKCYNLIELDLSCMTLTNLIPLSIPSTLKRLTIFSCIFELSSTKRELILPHDRNTKNVKIIKSNDLPQVQLNYFRFSANLFADSDGKRFAEIRVQDFYSLGSKHLHIVGLDFVEVDCSRLANCIEKLVCGVRTRLIRSVESSECSLRILQLMNRMNPEGIQSFLFGCPHLVELQLGDMKGKNFLFSTLQLPPSVKRLKLRNVDFNFSYHKLEDLQVEIYLDSLDTMKSVVRLLKSLSAENLCIQYTYSSSTSVLRCKDLVDAMNQNNSKNIFLNCKILTDTQKKELKLHIPGSTNDSEFFLFRNGKATAFTEKEWENICEKYFSFDPFYLW